MAAPPIVERHKHHFHRQAPIKESVRAATTADITIATALNNGDTLDGVTLATGDRVLVKNQSTGSQNGIYEVGVSPARSYDVSSDDPDVRGALVYVREGTANAGKLFKNTNTAAITIGTTALTFAEFASGGGSLTVEEVDGSPTVAATKLVLPNGTLGVVGTVATYTPAGGGSGNLTAPSAVSVDQGAASLLTRRAAANTEDDHFDAGSLDAKWLTYTNDDATVTFPTGMEGWAKFVGGAKIQAVPVGDWTIETEVIVNDIGAAAFTTAGLHLSNGTNDSTSQRAFWGVGQNNSLQSYRYVAERFNNGAFAATYSQWVLLIPALTYYFVRINKAGTTYTFEYSVTGKTWQRFFQTGALNFTPTHFGLMGDGHFNYFLRY